MLSSQLPKDVFSGFSLRRDVPACEYTSFRIGGPMAAFAEPKTADELATLIGAAESIGYPYYIIGNGSNLLIPDEGVNALFIHIGSGMSAYEIQGKTVTAEAGALLSTIARSSVAYGLAGLEWAAGIPGTVGGGVAMNAGAYGGEVKSVLKTVSFIENGVLNTAYVAEDDLGYRRSAFAFPNRVIVKAVFELSSDDGSAKTRMLDYTSRRREKQPLEYPSAGSTFKRPEGHFAGDLIERAGLKGKRVGGAMVSPKHAGFIINCGGATFADVTGLIELVQDEVYKKFKVMLEPEVKIIK